jgi:hypothetical protein
MRRRFAYLFLLFSVTAVPTASGEKSTYDLAVDRAERAELARSELGKRTKVKVVEDVFVVVGQNDGNALMESAVAAYFNQRFDRRPARAISVYLFSTSESYDAYCKKHLGEPCISIYGFYRPDLRRIVMNAGLGLGTLTHELVHPIIETDFPSAPTWINEGIASLFEAPVIPRPGEIHGRKNWRYPRLARALQNADDKGKVALEHLFALSDTEFRGEHEDLNYATARYFCQWLDGQGKLWAFYRGWRDGYDADQSGALAFERATGMTPKAATPLFVKWLRALK